MAKKSKPLLTKSKQKKDKQIAKQKKDELQSHSRAEVKKKTLRGFYGKLKGSLGDALEYQKKVRCEWEKCGNS